MIRAVNIRLHPYDVYIGRAGKGQKGTFGNPVAIGKECPVCNKKHMDAGSTLPCYKTYLDRRIKSDQLFDEELWALVHKANENYGSLDLGCFCVDKNYQGPCHGNVLAEELTKRLHTK